MNNLHKIHSDIPLWVKQLVCAYRETIEARIWYYYPKTGKASDYSTIEPWDEHQWRKIGWDYYMNQTDVSEFRSEWIIIK